MTPGSPRTPAAPGGKLPSAEQPLPSDRVKILFGIQTTGHGHLVRSSAMVSRLRELGHEVHAIFSGPPVAGVWLERTGEPYSICRGLTFVHDQGRVRYVATTLQLNLLRFVRDVFRYPVHDYDLVVSDYEPVTAYMGVLRRVPTIGISHLYAFSHKSVPTAKGNLLTNTILKAFAPASVPLGAHWDPFGAPILPPILTPEIIALKRGAVEQDLVLVYLNFEDLEEVVELLQRFPRHRFRYFAKVDQGFTRDNVEVLPISRETFLEDLSRCAGVFCNAGFTLPSEALHLGVKLLVKPLLVQVEQESNALALEQLGKGTVMYRLDADIMGRWLEAPAPEPMVFPDVNAHVIDWLHNGAREPVASLSDRMWELQRKGAAAAGASGLLKQAS